MFVSRALRGASRRGRVLVVASMLAAAAARRQSAEADVRAAYDVVIVGGGNAALCAALSAANAARACSCGVRPRSIAAATAATRQLRCAHGPAPAVSEATGRTSSSTICAGDGSRHRRASREAGHSESITCGEWMGARGVRFQDSLEARSTWDGRISLPGGGRRCSTLITRWRSARCGRAYDAEAGAVSTERPVARCVCAYSARHLRWCPLWLSRQAASRRTSTGARSLGRRGGRVRHPRHAVTGHDARCCSSGADPVGDPKACQQWRWTRARHSSTAARDALDGFRSVV